MKGIDYMKQIIPFKKELLFKTKVSEITSISLEHNLSLTTNDLISGEFIITGDYKMTDASINREKFNFTLPFDIALDSRYDSNNLIIDIDNFYYEVINNEFLTVNIDVYIEGEKQSEKPQKIENTDERKDFDSEDEAPIITLIPPKNNEPSLIKPIELPTEEEMKKEEDLLDVNINYQRPPITILNEGENNSSSKNNNLKNEFNLFENIDNSDTYATYHVYIVKQNDTIDSIMEKFNVKKENLSIYNDLENIKVGMKLIIPYES